MKFLNTENSFGFIAKSFHWIMAVLILGLLTVGYVMNSMGANPAKINLVYLHKSFGILVLMLAAGRLIWRLYNPRPKPLPSLKWWEDGLAKIVHFCLYAAFFAMPIAGWVMTSAGDYPATFFGLFTLPHIAPKNREVMEIARMVHNTLAPVIIGLLLLHFSGAAKHHVIDHDSTLKRMTWDRLGYVGGIILLACLGIILAIPAKFFLNTLFEPDQKPAQQTQHTAQASAPAAATPAGVHDAMPWTIVPADSHIKFKVMQYSQAFEGAFPHFTGDIFFDPDKLPQSYVNISIDTAVDTGSGDRDQQATTPDWFDSKSYPMATFTASSFEKTRVNQYLAHGALTLRGVNKPVNLPFTLDIHAGADGKKEALMHSEISLNRRDFGIGQGEWQQTNVIGDAVAVQIDVKAKAAQ